MGGFEAKVSLVYNPVMERVAVEQDIQEFSQRLEKIKAEEEKGRNRINGYLRRSGVALLVAGVMFGAQLCDIATGAYGLLAIIPYLLFPVPVFYSVLNVRRGALAKEEMVVVRNKREALESALEAKQKYITGQPSDNIR